MITVLRAWLSRRIAPGLACCFRCRTSLWGPIRNQPHTTTTVVGGGLPLCERCWASLTPEERWPYYDALVDLWIEQVPWRIGHHEKERKALREAVMAGQ